MNLCVICKKPATNVVTDVDENNPDRATQTFYCDDHARIAGFRAEEHSAAVRRVLHNFRRLIEFVKQNNRWPRTEEQRQLGVSGDFPRCVADSELAKQLAYFELVAEFMEKNGEFPREDELPPDPFVP